MNITRAELKSNARARLSNKWGEAIGAYVIPTAISVGVMMIWMFIFMGSMFAFTSAITNSFNRYGSSYGEALFGGAAIGTILLSVLFFLLITFFVLMPINFGTTYWFYKLAKGQPTSLSDIFAFFRSGAAYKSALLYNLNVGIRAMGWGLLFGFISALLTALIPFLGLLTTIATSIATMFIVYRYAVGSTILFDNNFTISTSEAIRRSIAATKGKLVFMFVMNLSFIGWAFLSMIPFVLLYTGPYITATLMEMYRYICDTTYGRPDGGQQGFNQSGGPQGFNPNMQANTFVQQPPAQDSFVHPQPMQPAPFSENPFTPQEFSQQPVAPVASAVEGIEDIVAQAPATMEVAQEAVAEKVEEVVESVIDGATEDETENLNKPEL